MRLATFVAKGPQQFPRVGIVNNGQILDVPGAWSALGQGDFPRSFVALAPLLDSGEAAMDSLRLLEESALHAPELWQAENDDQVKEAIVLLRKLVQAICVGFIGRLDRILTAVNIYTYKRRRACCCRSK